MALTVKWSECGVKEGSSPLERRPHKGLATCPRIIQVRWADRLQALKEIVGYSYTETVAGVRKLRRVLPEVHPLEPGLVADEAWVIRGKHWTGRAAYDSAGTLLAGYPNKTANADADGDTLRKLNEFGVAEIGITYKQVDYYLLTDSEVDALVVGGAECYRYVSFREERSAKYLGLPGGTLYVVPDLGGAMPPLAVRTIAYPVGVIEGTATLYYVWRNVDVNAVPWRTIENCVGKVNKTAIFGYAAGTLLFMPPRIERYPMANGYFGADIEFTWMSFAPGHNKILRKSTSGKITYEWVVSDSTVVTVPVTGSLPSGANRITLYEEAEFFDVFNPNLP